MIGVALNDGKRGEIVRVMMGQPISAIRWARYVPDNIWVTRFGHHIEIKNLGIDHLKACIHKIQWSRTGWRTRYLYRLLRELDLRAMG